MKENYLRQAIQMILFAVFALVYTADLNAQNTVRGTVVDGQTGEPIVGAAIIQSGTTRGTVSDIDGNFSLNVESLPTDIEASFLGYISTKLTATTNDVGKVELQTDSKTLDDVVIKSSIAVARKTPVALSTISTQHIEEKLGTQEFPEILKSTPGVHANVQGGGYGDSEIYMRGFDNTNVATMINGVPMNDMENGSVYWSNWAGLTDVTANMQTQRGLGASKVSNPSVGGTINIITKGLEAKRGGFLSYAMGTNNMNKVLFTFSTGMTDNGWAITALGGKQWGDGLGQGMEYVGYNYFFSISKLINLNHQISFSIFGAPQEHNQRSSYSALTLEQWKYAEKVYGVGDYKYNATYGYDKYGQRKNSDFNHYHKPQMSLNHTWQMDNGGTLSTAIYASIGRGYGYSCEANENIDGAKYSDMRGGYQGEILTKFRREDGTFDYGAIQDINENSEHGSAYIMSKSINYHDWYGLLSTYTTRLFDFVDFYGGIDFRWYKGKHTNEICDLYNGKYFIDSTRGSISAANNSRAADSEWVNEKLGVGDIVYRDYDGHVVQEGAFFQGEVSLDALTAFVSGSLSNTSYWRYDRYYYDKTHAKSDVMSYIGGTVKAGANYNLNEQNNVFVNLGFISRAPKLSGGAFMQSTTSNVTNPNAQNEKILSCEVGYGFRLPVLDVKLNGYITKWKDKAMTKYGNIGDSQTEFYMNMTGVDALHKGIELEVKAPLAKWVELNGMLSIGDWRWNSNAKGYAYNELGQGLDKDGNVTEIKGENHVWSIINLKDVRVGGSAQTTAALGVNFNIDNFRIGADWTLQARNYSYYSFSGSNLSLGKETNIADPWRIPHASTIDANASYKFDFGKVRATVSGNVNNLLNYHYITKAWNPSVTSDANEDNIYCFFNMGRNCSVRLKLNF